MCTRIPSKWTFAAVALLMLPIYGCITRSQEARLGAEEAKKVEQTMGLMHDAKLEPYVRAIGEKLAAASDMPEGPWYFMVVDLPDPNAFALPGGFIYVTRGLVSLVNSEDELAGVIGHEIGHVTARHSVEQMSRAQLAQLGLGVAAIASEEFRQYAGLASQGLNVLFLKFGRDDENQSDSLGLRYMTRAGYDPHEMPKVFATLDRVTQSHSLRGTPQWLSTHPDPGNRIANIDARIGQLPPELQQGTVGRESYLNRLAGMIFADDPRQGYTIGQTYYHPELSFKIDFPNQWQIINQRQAVGALSPNRDASVVLTLSDKDSPRAAFEAFFSQQGIQRGPNRGRNIYSFRAVDTQTGEGRAEGLIGYLSHDGQVYQLMGYTGLDTWQGYANGMHESLASFTRVTDRRYLEVSPATIDIVKLPRSMNLTEFVRRYPSTIDVEQLALINGVNVDTVMDPGRLVKRVIGGKLPAK